MWNELTFLWNELTILWNDLTTDRNDLTWNHLTMERASYFTDLEKKEHKCLKTSTVFILHFAPSLRFTLSLQSAFYTQSAVYPWSAVCSLQSAVFVLH